MKTKLDINKWNPFVRRLSFQLGEVRISVRAGWRLDHSDIVTGIRRHALGDWGELDERDCKLNDRACEKGRSLLSRYFGQEDQEFLVITEADRSATWVVLPEEYRP